ncbi:MAG: MerR family transcriptional regulator [Bacteriovoracaceae bacterium]|nr:MerR family transcriptional regulator [Bacteriovoracaceae bacterium]
MKEKQLYQIGTLAEKAQVNIQTIRYYERIKILAPKLRKDSKRVRFYDNDSLKTLLFIKNAQELGFQLDEIKDLLKLRSENTGRCDRVRKRASEKLENVQFKIKNLKAIEKNLKNLIDECETKKNQQECPILEGMEAHNE